MITEEEAKGKWCPMVRFYDYRGRGMSNREEFIDNHAKADSCLASACMMWRWKVTPKEAANNAQHSYSAPKIEAGYCGLGGKP